MHKDEATPLRELRQERRKPRVVQGSAVDGGAEEHTHHSIEPERAIQLLERCVQIGQWKARQDLEPPIGVARHGRELIVDADRKLLAERLGKPVQVGRR